MDFEKVKELMHTLDNSTLMDFELKLNDGFSLRMNKYSNNPIQTSTQIVDSVVENVGAKNVELEKHAITAVSDTKQEIAKGSVVTSPIVGTFYSSSSPSSAPYVKVGDKVKEGDTLCIIEAMKVMNEITSQCSGEIVEIMVENEDMVEYNQPLFRIV